MMEKYTIIAFNPDGTEDFVDWSDDFNALWKKKNAYQRKERKDWIKEGGVYKVLKVIEFAPDEKKGDRE